MIERPIYIEIGYIIGGDQGHLLVAKLLGMFVAHADREGLVCKVLEIVLAPQRGMRCARLELHAGDRERIMALHQGAHSLIRVPPHGQHRQMSCAGVRVSYQAGLPLPDTMSEWGEERRRYFYDPDQAIMDAVLGRLEIDPEVIFGGDFSPLTSSDGYSRH